MSEYKNKKSGLYFRVDNDVHPEVRRACLDFGRWIRTIYDFPVRVIVYIKSSKRIRAQDGELVYDIFWWPCVEEFYYPHIRISTGEYVEDCENRGQDNALSTVLTALARMLGTYYLWIDGILPDLSDYEADKRSYEFADEVLNEYSQTRDHP